jgi:hypothetical protein
MSKNGPQCNSLGQRKSSGHIFQVGNIGVHISALTMYLKNLDCDLKLSVNRI